MEVEWSYGAARGAGGILAVLRRNNANITGNILINNLPGRLKIPLVLIYGRNQRPLSSGENGATAVLGPGPANTNLPAAKPPFFQTAVL